MPTNKSPMWVGPPPRCPTGEQLQQKVPRPSSKCSLTADVRGQTQSQGRHGSKTQVNSLAGDDRGRGGLAVPRQLAGMPEKAINKVMLLLKCFQEIYVKTCPNYFYQGPNMNILGTDSWKSGSENTKIIENGRSLWNCIFFRKCVCSCPGTRPGFNFFSPSNV